MGTPCITLGMLWVVNLHSQTAEDENYLACFWIDSANKGSRIYVNLEIGIAQQRTRMLLQLTDVVSSRVFKEGAHLDLLCLMLCCGSNVHLGKGQLFAQL